MGYDDNTMLTGVTGGGLPADIWRETMQRVHEGVPIKPLPMQEPNQPQQAAQPFSMLPDNGANDMNIIENLLFRLLGRNDR
jgi:membrane peptidoglycan carboxypeptidase